MQPLKLKTTIKRLGEFTYEMDFVHANKELLHLPSYGANEFTITRGDEDSKGGRLRLRTLQRFVEMFGPQAMTEMVTRVNREFGNELYEAGIIEN